jgi:hypothetical protein
MEEKRLERYRALPTPKGYLGEGLALDALVPIYSVRLLDVSPIEWKISE